MKIFYPARRVLSERRLHYVSALMLAFIVFPVQAQHTRKVKVEDDGWARNSVNAVIFRKNSLVTWKDTQFAAFYSDDQYLVVAKRKQGSDHWQISKTGFKAHTEDAHNTISLMVDGEGYLHLAWDHHNTPLHYCRSTAPGALELTDALSMTGVEEQRVTYPEFYQLKNGNLLFLYRSGESGKGNLVINRYDVAKKQWTTLHKNLIDGEGQRNAYWQAYADANGSFHISWVWRETPDVASNHDLCYARSDDGGITWKRSSGNTYDLPITAATAEYAWKIPAASELINQTSMTTDETGRPYIATYWREQDSKVPQYKIVYHTPAGWKKISLDFRQTPFSLSGGGTKRIPVSRPQLLVSGAQALLIFRDEERQNKVSVATFSLQDHPDWKILDLTNESVGQWEPTFDTELWKQKKLLHLFLQKVEQADAEGQTSSPPQPIFVLEYDPFG